MNHLHLAVKASGLRAPITDTVDMGLWLVDVVDAVRMKVLAGPYCVRCDTPGNEGVTGCVVIETSHCAIHLWEQAEGGPFFSFCLYSCADFGSGEVIRMIRDRFAPERITWTLLDRNGDAPEVIEMGSWDAVAP